MCKKSTPLWAILNSFKFEQRQRENEIFTKHSVFKYLINLDILKYQQYLKLCTCKFLQEKLKLKEINNSIIIPNESLSNISKFTIKSFSGLLIFTNKPYNCYLFASMNLPRCHVFAAWQRDSLPCF